jgi:putative multicomponent Na+:H+ antiporter subunit B
MTNTMTDLDLLAIVALLPIAAVMTIVQTNPYHALVVRGILGAIAALVYALLGAADVALTEALVGTMLATTLYMVAVRSSLVLQLGILVEVTDASEVVTSPDSLELLELKVAQAESQVDARAEVLAESQMQETPNDRDQLTLVGGAIASPELDPLIAYLRVFCRQHSLRLELVPYADREALYAALETRDVHAIGTFSETTSLPEITVRVQRLHDLMHTELNPAIATLHPIFPVEISAIAPASKSSELAH